MYYKYPSPEIQSSIICLAWTHCERVAILRDYSLATATRASYDTDFLDDLANPLYEPRGPHFENHCSLLASGGLTDAAAEDVSNIDNFI
ncbi:unnamed protein product [Timema podura]|uniref:Uncharacterized protein n=1 Tax=Timema podura TaxID=61482 RepID=A0ABN7NZK6_TIMPD|nr:unnamed protein product [Timema podura]